MTNPLTIERISRCYDIARDALLDQRRSAGHWVGELSTSALSTATAIVAMEMVRRHRSEARSDSASTEAVSDSRLEELSARGLDWLANHQNADGGWGDTTKSISNISTTMLAHAAFFATGVSDRYASAVEAAEGYIERAGGVEAVLSRYGKDRTFSVPILTHCALAGTADWQDVIPLPFELACIPARFYKTVRLPVVSYALPALIAIGQARYHHRKPANFLTRWIRGAAIRRSLAVLETIQPENGGFLEATPLTSFVTMSLASIGLADHPVTRRGLQFICDSVRPDGSWPIDTNLATWVTTLSVNALEEDLPQDGRETIRQWLLGQQYRDVHRYTQAEPGGWAWTDLPGGVPDADDTPGALLALMNLRGESGNEFPEAEQQSLKLGIGWLLDLQNRDGGWPTFCSGWGALPFDRSSPDITAHVIRALLAWSRSEGQLPAVRGLLPTAHVNRAIRKGFAFLAKIQRPDGSWIPLWFGNQYAENEENPTYGTARVLAAYRDADQLTSGPATRALEWLRNNQNTDGGWGVPGMESSVEESALALEIIMSAAPNCVESSRGLDWLLTRIENDTFVDSSPIGFYFAKLWYFEKLYPHVFITAAFRQANETFCMAEC